MMNFVALAALVLAIGLTVGPAKSFEWTGKVKNTYLDSKVFTIEHGNLEVKFWLGYEPSEPLLKIFGQLQAGDTIRLTVDDEEAIVRTIEIVQRATSDQ